MKKSLIRPICFALAQLAMLYASAQLNDNFTDGDFTANPPWTGNTADWTIHSSQRLQSNNTTANSSFYLSTASRLVAGAQWELSVQLAFNTSSANYVDIYLAASASDISQNNTSGYFVRLGNTADDICLYRKDLSGISTLLINGLDGTLNTSNNNLKLKVTCDAHYQWTLLRDLGATGNNYLSEGNATDSTYTSSSYFGILVKQSTASFFQKHFFDDIAVTPYAPDITPPALVSAVTTGANALDILFSEPVDPASAQATGNYFADNGIGFPATAILDASNHALLYLRFSQPFPNGVNCRLSVTRVKDLAGNTLNNGNAVFSFYTAQPYDVIIDEIMADPNPPVGLPPYEFIELKNTSSHALDLFGWQAGDSIGFATINTHVVLQSDSFLILTGNTAAASFAPYGTTLGISNFPALNNEGDQLYIRSREGKTIHAVAYTSSWYHNDIKSKGGWTLEMMDAQNPCSGAGNWTASADSAGGTPARKNAAQAVNKDTQPPVLLSAFAPDSSSIILLFDEPLDSLAASAPAHYIIDGSIGTAQSAVPQAPLFTTVQLKTKTPLKTGTVYMVTANGLTDCMGNLMAGFNTCRTGLASVPDTFDVVINEVLFNPRPGGVDYIELYNRGTKIINLKDVYVASRAASGVLGSEKLVSNDNRLLFPGDYVVTTEDPSIVQQQYLCKNPAAFAFVATMPSYPNDQGDVVMLNSRGRVVDELRYDEKWHFGLITNNEGVALERISYHAPTQNASNWHSAATSAGYGTPGYQNSQWATDPQTDAMISITPAIFSPDNDGMDDVATIAYRFPNRGYVCNITIFDANGRPVRYLTHNAICSTGGYFRWDGLDEKNRKLPIGVYVVYTEAFTLQGQTKHWKQAITLARKF
jgi:hypothetical protein